MRISRFEDNKSAKISEKVEVILHTPLTPTHIRYTMHDVIRYYWYWNTGIIKHWLHGSVQPKNFGRTNCNYSSVLCAMSDFY